MNTAIDFIGDIHGHCDELCALLKKLGYVERGGAYRYPGDARTVVFLGDYVDRGPQIRETVNLVRAMRDAGSAVALMGNHEFNMLGFWHRNGDKGRFLKKLGSGYLRRHSLKNISTHVKTIEAYAGREEEFGELLEFAKTLPFYLETATFRALHACFDDGAIGALKRAGVRSFADGSYDELVYRVHDEDDELGNSLFHPLDVLLKGPEMDLPNGLSFRDKDGNERHRARLRWWVDPRAASFNDLSFERIEGGDDPGSVPKDVRGRSFYGRDERPVFFGHYWLKGVPRLQADNVCCLDYSVAKPEDDGGRLAGYRFDGEQQLDENKFVYVKG